MGDVKSLARTFHRKQVWCIAMHGKSVKLYKKTIFFPTALKNMARGAFKMRIKNKHSIKS